MPQWTARVNSRPADLSEIREADGDNQEGFNPFPRGDDERLERLKHEGDAWK